MSAVDAAGNTATTSFTYSADTVPPSAVTLSIPTYNRRRPSVTLDWTAVADDGATGTAAAAYDIRFGLSALSDANFDSA